MFPVGPLAQVLRTLRCVPGQWGPSPRLLVAGLGSERLAGNVDAAVDGVHVDVLDAPTNELGGALTKLEEGSFAAVLIAQPAHCLFPGAADAVLEASGRLVAAPSQESAAGRVGLLWSRLAEPPVGASPEWLARVNALAGASAAGGIDPISFHDWLTEQVASGPKELLEPPRHRRFLATAKLSAPEAALTADATINADAFADVEQLLQNELDSNNELDCPLSLHCWVMGRKE